MYKISGKLIWFSMLQLTRAFAGMTITHRAEETTVVDLTQLFGRMNISDIVVRFPVNFTDSGLQLIPRNLGTYNYGQSVEPYELISSLTSRMDLANGTTGLKYNSTYRQFWAANGRSKWSYTTGGPIYESSPAIGVDGSIYVGSNDNKLYSLNANGTYGALRWSYPTGNSIYSSPAIGVDGSIYVGSYDNKLYSLNANGTLRLSYGVAIWLEL